MSEEELLKTRIEVIKYLSDGYMLNVIVDVINDTIELLQEYKQLEQENKELKERINKYEDPEDLMLMFMYCDEKAKDKIKELQERIDKAIEYIEYNATSNYFDKEKNMFRREEDLLDILKGVE